MITNQGIVPRWIDHNLVTDGDDICMDSIRAIVEGGCASEAYMPAVTYHQALRTMAEHGDDVFDFIETHYGEIPLPDDFHRGSWSHMACFYLSTAVELWAMDCEH